MKKHIPVFIAVVLALAILAPIDSVADPADESVEMTPHNSTVVIQPSGGTFDYFVTAGNDNATSLPFQIWTMATLPNGNQVGPV